MLTKAILFLFSCSEVNSNWLITCELANQHARKVLFTCVVLVIVIVAVVIVMLLLLILSYMLMLYFNSFRL